ncbi:Enoyl-CoA hydratase/isomerase [Sphingobium chlorophenolicum L-1]|uniref:Enoyl-CoA hydratase/isomerase n=1 Tax=Sphingobium chlorophenolicum L-1 TaxID=690566 RepID=F6F201_SPHCR|nr:enoyl-CoA hydratase-related protein [Sphingobium chlorophenolicum]AEG51567.1 Enoyl-CoA hydratase/isomerase [Sphingobium chlorophenolicum L-1]
MTNSTSPLIVEERGAALHVTLNRPERLNAMDPVLVTELRDLFTRLYWRHDLRAVVLTGAGRGFCAGLDIVDADRAAGNDVGEVLIAQRRISEIVIAMRRCPQPIVALVNGPASGGGFALALAADIRVATPALKMNAAFIRLGLSACDIGVSYFLPRMVGSSVAADYMLTGRFFDADAALRHGLVSRIVEQEDLAATGDEILESLLHATPLGLRLTKEALNFAIDAPGLEAAVAMEDRNQALTAQGPDFAEGIAAFREKRKPKFAG